jgi:hypothetical protein
MGLADRFEAVVIFRCSADCWRKDRRIEFGCAPCVFDFLTPSALTRSLIAAIIFRLASPALRLCAFFISARRFAFNACLSLRVLSSPCPFLSVTLVLITAATTPAIVPAAIVAIFIITLIARTAALFIALGARFILARLVVSNHPEIVVCELEVVFGLNPVAIVLRILSKLLILVEQLGRIAACTAVNPVLIIAALVAAVTAAATAIVIAIVIQGKSSC